MIYLFFADVTPLSDDNFFDLALNELSPERKQKVNRLNYRKDKNLSAGSHLLLKYALKKTGYDYSTLNFKTEKNGKPYIEGENLFFSISHSGNMVLCGLSDSPIGVDIEKISDFNPGILSRVFGENEQKVIASQKNDDKRRNMFFKIWTLKESYAKMTGVGLGGLKNFEVVSEGGTKSNALMPKCKFFEFESEGYKISASYTAKDTLNDIEKIDLVCCVG